MDEYLTASWTTEPYRPKWLSTEYAPYVPNPTSTLIAERMLKFNAIITDVKILSPDKVVQVIFADGTSEKAVCSENDTFNLEIGITICIAKKFLGGTKEYNKTIRNVLKTMERNEKDRKDRDERSKRIALKRQKEAEKRRERKIKIQEEAYYRAMKRIESEKQE